MLLTTMKILMRWMLLLHLTSLKKSAPPHIIKDFDFTQSSPRPSSAPRTPSRMPIEDDDVDMGIGGDSEWYQIFCVTTDSHVVVGDVEIGGAEDVSGLRVRSGTAFGERWELVSSSTSFSEPTQFSDAKRYADYIFDGGRFSAHTVLCAFENWAGKWWKGAGDVVVREFQSVLGTARSRVVSCVEEVRDVKNAVSTMLERGLDSNSSGGPVDKKQAVLQRWHQLLEYCIELDKTEHAAFGVSTASGLPLGLLISRRGQISALRPVDPIEGLELPNMVLVPTDVLRGHPYLHSISEQRFRAGVENLNNLLNVVNETLSVRERSGFLASVREALKKPVQGSVEASVLRPGFEKWFKESLSGEKKNRIQVGVASVLGGIEEVLQFVANAFGVSGGASQSPGRKGLVDLFKLGSSTVGEQEEWVQSLGVKTFVEVVAARVKVSENILVLLGVLVGLNQGNVGKKEVARWVGLYQNVVVAEWISKTNVITVESKSQTDDMMDLDVEGSSISEKLPLSLFLSRAFSKEGSKGLQIKKPTKTVESKGAVLLEFVYTVFRSLGLFAVAEQTSTQQQLQSAPPLKVSSLLMYSCWALASAGQAKIAVELLGFYPKETNSLQYLDGFAKLKAGDYDAAKVALEKAGNCFIGGLGKLEKEWHLLLEDSVLVGGELGYYRHVIALFEEERVHKVVAHFAKLALGVIPDKEELYESLWKTMFSHSLEAKEFESAHGFLKEAEIETQKICIRSFITALCQNHEIDALCCRYVFGKLQSEVEETLIFQAKARKVAPIPSAQKGTPISEPNYHQILYCYYTTRGNNRDAAAIMYDYARRLNSVSSLDIGGGSLVGVITEQSRAYLAAINSLSLVAEDYRWILYKTTVESASHPLAKRRKVGLVTNDSDYGTNVKSSQARNQEIVDLDEIRKEYTLTMAKLTLAHHYRDLSVSAGLPDPEVAVKLLAENAQFDQAILLAETFKIRLDEIFGRFGAHCVVLMEADINSGIKAPYQPVIDDAPVEWEGTNSDKAWLSLKLRLEQQQRKRKHTTYTLRKAIADRSLAQSSKVDLPDWLINGFKVEKPEDLIHVYLSHNLTKKAAQFAIDFVTQYTNSLPEFGDRIQPSHSVKLLPYSALDQLIATLDEVTAGAANEELKDLRTRLAASLYTYLLRTGEDTINFIGKDSANTAKIAHAIAAQPPQHISKTLRHEGAMGPFANKTLTKDMSGVLSGGGSSSILSRLGPAVQATST
ncbi:hypothetical protein BCR33DRAFT_453683 [Rhizoclosmatium globosum]|uniref:Uncharacterized protein n=1 Tax=Rhizoclosmatium globosum TaxID=329046 RepID=A0A1Y2CWH9_9FUNG|nr:hypothetical protein BCR33DRAFT_453683 [Rhizoclosmatium globosum]|eukprot:ORY51388.1 hypothetical protein BCR33DRAFT_453683 [Rhizoclosmatium globosum]